MFEQRLFVRIPGINSFRDVKGIQKQWPKLVPDAPKDIIPDMVQVKQLLIAYGVGIKATF